MKVDMNKFMYLAAGCGIGLALGALFAPQSGRQTRQTVGKKVDDLTHKVQERIQSSNIRGAASQTWHNAVEKGKNVIAISQKRFNQSTHAQARNLNEPLEGHPAEGH
jgi:gas vesicle protein